MAKQDKEKCPKCGSTIFALAKDKSGKRYCQAKGCQHVWAPETMGMGRVDIVLKQAQKENVELKEAINSERAKVKRLEARVAELEAKYEPKVETAESEIFS